MDIKAVLARAAAELEEAEVQAAAIQARVQDLRAMRDGLQLAMDKYDPADGSISATSQVGEIAVAGDGEDGGVQLPLGIPTPDSVAGERSQSDLAMDVVSALARPTETVEVRNLLKAAGWNYSQEQVRSALTYLLRTERIIRVAPGTWALPKPAVEDDAGESR
jgi:hypothetical protein